MAETDAADNLRAHLRAATMAAHELLGDAMQAASGWRSITDYARFLRLQHAARSPLEDWLDTHAPGELRPPRQTGLIACDLFVLGQPVPEPAGAFVLQQARPDRSLAEAQSESPGEALGAAWVLAGSALGNRAILKQVERARAARADHAWPTAFLGDGQMAGFWHGLRRRIERPALAGEASGAARAAAAVFAHFLAHVRGDYLRGEPVRDYHFGDWPIGNRGAPA